MIAQKLLEFRFILLILTIITVVMAFGSIFPMPVKQVAVTLSNCIREIIMFTLPFLVVPFVVSSLAMLGSRGTKMLTVLIGLIFLSNFVTIVLGGSMAAAVTPFFQFATEINQGQVSSIQPYFEWALPDYITVEMMLMVGFILGYILGRFPNQKAMEFTEKSKAFCSFCFTKILIPALPVYIFGTLIQIEAETDFTAIFHDFGIIIGVIILTQVVYTSALFLWGSHFKIPKTLGCIKNALPAGMLGFSTMSSLVTMPYTLRAAEKNLGDKQLAQITITSTVNCHIVGECISMAALAVAIYCIGSGGTLPSLTAFLTFAFFATLVQFSAVAVPGGSIVVLIPVLISKLGFSPEMVGLITTMSIFMDPIGTGFNVMGNSAFALLMKRIFGSHKAEIDSLPKKSQAKSQKAA